MVTVSESIWIDAPVDRVFEYLDDPHNHAVVTPSLSSVRNVEPLDNGGKRVEHTYRMADISLDGDLVERVHEDSERMVFDLEGDLEGEIDLEFEAVDDGTELTYAATYELPGRVLSAVAEPFVRRYNERELQTTLENVRTRLAVEER